MILCSGSLLKGEITGLYGYGMASANDGYGFFSPEFAETVFPLDVCYGKTSMTCDNPVSLTGCPSSSKKFSNSGLWQTEFHRYTNCVTAIHLGSLVDITNP